MSVPDHILIGTLDPAGELVLTPSGPMDIKSCSHLVMVPEHYRPDGSCRCDDPDHAEMDEWGYTWDGTVWR